LLNKPAGFVSTCHDPRDRRTILDLLPPELRHGYGIHPVGRLDTDSTGALLLTNDGDLTFVLTHPRHEISKTYRVWVEGDPSAATLRQWRQGVMLSGRRTLPARVCRLRTSADQRTELEIILWEGRNRQIRRVAEQLGHPVIQLHRTAIGSIQLQTVGASTLPSGAYRSLEDGEISFLKAQVDLLSERVSVERREDH
jgi:23S rRNA pseudouridine2605 synthase